MNRLTLLVVVLVVAVPLTSPAAGFGTELSLTADAPATASVGERIAFEAELTNASNVDYRWEFGDGSTARGWLVSNTFEEPGRYGIIVTANRDGTNRSTMITITITPPNSDRLASETPLRQ